MKRQGSLLLLLVILLLPLGAESLDLETSLNLALENNLDFQVSKIGLETASRENDHSWNNYLPSLSASAGVTGSDSFSEPDSDSWSSWADFDASLSLSPSKTLDVEELELAYQSELLTLETDRLELINKVETAFYGLLASSRNIDIEEANLALAEKRYESTQAEFDRGMTSELSVLQAKVNAANIKPAYLQAVSDYETDLREFLTLIGLDTDTQVELVGTLDTPTQEFDSDVLIDTYLSNRRDILEAQKNLEVLENSRKQEAADNRSPYLTLSAGWTPEYDDPFEGGLGDSDYYSDSLSLKAYVTIPLDDWIPGSDTSDSIASYKDDIRAAELSLEKTREEAKTEIINYVEQLETAAANLELSRLNVELYKLTYEKSEESYNQGGMEQLDLEDAQQDYFSAEQDYLESQYSYLEGLINLRYALGLESLDEIIQ
ncbi:MAG: TolC family protein [Spirochaetales bacterium]|nr:TolC family protein [Spirochaetales bacterium]